jgi:hypothetical protein
MKRLVIMAITKMCGEAILLTIIAGIVIGVIGNINKWDTSIRYTNNWKGSSMGFAKNVLLNLPRRLPELKNFFMVGQWVGDMGVGGAAKSSRDIVQLICKQDKKRFMTTEA